MEHRPANMTKWTYPILDFEFCSVVLGRGLGVFCDFNMLYYQLCV